MKIFVLGPTQSGKTCLAAGLSNTSYGKTLFHRAFVAKASGDASSEEGSSQNESAADRLAKLRLRIEGGSWPDPTTDPEPKTLDFVLQWKGTSIALSFDDYKGEQATTRKILSRLEALNGEDAVILLINPGFKFEYVRESKNYRLATDAEISAPDNEKPEGYTVESAFVPGDSPVAPLARRWLGKQESVYDQLIKSLEKDSKNAKKSNKNKPVVAVAITASDRLSRKGDLRAFRPQFQEFLEKITNRLETAGFDYKVHSVTMSGFLQNQLKPQFAPGRANKSPKPFIWAFRRLRLRSLQEKLAKEMRFTFKILGWVLLVACLGFVLWKWYESDCDDKKISEWISTCTVRLTKSEFGLADLKDAKEAWESLCEHKGFYAEKAAEAANELEPSIWKKQELLIQGRIRNISEADGELGSEQKLGEVDDLFEAFRPVKTNLVAQYNRLCAKWDQAKPEFREAHTEYIFRENVEKPFRNSENVHGFAAMDKLYPLSDEIKRRKPATERLATIQTNLAEKLDRRIAYEWRVRAIPDFAEAGATNATAGAVEDFCARLNNWSPVSESGAIAKSNLVAFVATNKPAWRTGFETTMFSARVNIAIKGGLPEDLATLFPTRVATNDYLTAQFVEEQWTAHGKPAYVKSCTNFVERFVDSVRRRVKDQRPALTKDDEEKIVGEINAAAVPGIFDGAKALDEIRTQVDADARKWDAAKREECEKWVEENIAKRPERDRTGSDGLWKAYTTVRDRNSDDDSKAIFSEIVRTAVYEKIERWLESDLQVFQKERSKETVKNRFNDKFYPLCEKLRDDEKHYDPSSWARPFAMKCFDTGRIQDAFREGIEKAFPQTFEITQVRGRIVYDGKDPWGWGWAWTQIGFCIQAGVKPTPLVSQDKDDNTVIKNEQDNNKWKKLWSGSKTVTSHSFAPANLAMSAYDHRRRGASTQVKWLDKEFPQFTFPLYSFDGNIAAPDGKIEFGGPFGESSDRTMAAYVLVNIKRISGKSIGELLKDAKEEVKKQNNSK